MAVIIAYSVCWHISCSKLLLYLGSLAFLFYICVSIMHSRHERCWKRLFKWSCQKQYVSAKPAPMFLRGCLFWMYESVCQDQLADLYVDGGTTMLARMQWFPSLRRSTDLSGNLHKLWVVIKVPWWHIFKRWLSWQLFLFIAVLSVLNLQHKLRGGWVSHFIILWVFLHFLAFRHRCLQEK